MTFLTSPRLLAILSLIIPGNFAQIDHEFPSSYDPNLEIFKRSDLRSAMAKLDPNFWPARGRRNNFDIQKSPKYLLPFDLKYNNLPEYNDLPSSLERRDAVEAVTTGNRGRKTDDEESGVFWAGRGRNVDYRENEPEETFWANRGRSLEDEDKYFYDYLEDPMKKNEEREISKIRTNESNIDDEEKQDEMDTRWRRHRLFVEEPGWVWLMRREAHPAYDVSFAGSKPFQNEKGVFWVARGKKHKKQKREISRFITKTHDYEPCRPYHPKRNSKNVMRELSQLNNNRFWPARGKRPALDLVAKHLAGADRGSFWPARGKRPFEEPEPFYTVAKRSEKPKILKTEKENK